MKKKLSMLMTAIVSLSSSLVMADQSEVQADEGLSALYQREYDVAEKYFLKKIEESSSNNHALMYLSFTYMTTRKTEQAVDYIEKALAITPNSVEELILSGDVYCNHAQNSSMFSALKMAKKCIAQYDSAVKQDGKSVDALVSAMQFYLTVPSLAGGSTEKGNALLETLKTLSPEHATTYQVAELDRAKKTDAALALADDLIKKDFSSAINQYLIAHFYRDKKQYDKALPLFASINKFPETLKNRWFIDDSLLQQGEILMIDNRDLPQAIKLIEEYKDKNRNPGDIHYFWSSWSLAKAYKAAGNGAKYDQLVSQIKSEDYKRDKAFANEFEDAINF